MDAGAAQTLSEQTEASDSPQQLRVLVVDDSRAQSRALSTSLRRRGYAVAQANSGEEALRLCQEQDFDIVLSDWMMPGMSGLEFCAAFRALKRDDYCYFILLTSKSDKSEISLGLRAGADDFLAKPPDPDEMQARMFAGERILRMTRELKEKNRLIGSTLVELQTLYDSLDRDLMEARKLQQSLLPELHCDFGSADVSLILRPSGHIGGDLVGFFPISVSRVGIYAIDVSGHGVASAIMTARLASVFSVAAPERNIALTRGPDGRYCGLPPDVVAARLNRMMFDGVETDQYFTLFYGEFDLLTGEVSMVQAGHPHPALCRPQGAIEWLGNGGLPVGLIEDADYERVEFTLAPGERLLVISDGVTECLNPSGVELDRAGLSQIVADNQKLRGEPFLKAMVWDLHGYAGGQDFDDDVSALLLEFHGSGRGSSAARKG